MHQSIIPLIASKVTHTRKVPMEKRERMQAIQAEDHKQQNLPLGSPLIMTKA
jgi:hypothetical protein